MTFCIPVFGTLGANKKKKRIASLGISVRSCSRSATDMVELSISKVNVLLERTLLCSSLDGMHTWGVLFDAGAAFPRRIRLSEEIRKVSVSGTDLFASSKRVCTLAKT